MQGLIHAAMDSTPIFVSLISTVGVVVVGFFGYLGIMAQVKKGADAVVGQVTELDSLNSTQHAQNAGLLQQMLDQITEQGVMIQSVINVQHYPIIKTDSKGSLIQINVAGVKLLGMDVPELKGNGWVDAIHPEDRLAVLEAWTDSVRESVPFGPINYRYKHPKTGHVTMVEAVATPVLNLNKEIISWVAIIVPLAADELILQD